MKTPALLVVAVAALALATGCLSRPALTKQTFALRPPVSVAATDAKALPAVGVKVSGVDPVYAGRPLVYRLTDQSFESDPYAEWLVAPELMVQDAIVGHLRASGVFADVFASDLAPRPSVTLRVAELGGDFRGDKPAAVLRVEAWFSKAAGQEQSHQRKAYTQRIELTEKTAAGVVAALDQALANIVKELVNDLSAVATR
jgi:cholesterol transport system auxiliary component